jgi:serine-type D-Ala-D-Ala carboxypeptidase/endopeptidase (penicillin-binding protein 4)
MKQTSHYTQSFLLFSIVTLSIIQPALASQEIPVELPNQNTPTDNNSIHIYVPEPEREPTPNNNNQQVCSASPQAAIEKIIGSSSTNWGILVESLQDGIPLYSHNADRYFIPASNVKLFTTAAALQRLNPEAPIHSTTVQKWITSMNLRSDNDYAQTLFDYIGGANVAKSALSQLGLDPKSYRLADGSGLSRSNIATPRSLVSMLRAMYFSPNGQVFENSLPIAGISGTLLNRMRLSPAEGKVHAKTGTLTGVRALSGYLEHPQSGLLVFSILVNRSNIDGSKLVKDIDHIMVELSSWQPCTSTAGQ